MKLWNYAIITFSHIPNFWLGNNHIDEKEKWYDKDGHIYKRKPWKRIRKMEEKNSQWSNWKNN